MNLDNLNKWLMLAANLGVIAGIIFLAIEINQNQENIELQNTLSLVESRASSTEFFNSTRLFMLDHPDISAVWQKALAGQPLNEEETTKFELLCSYDVWGRFNLYVRMSALNFVLEAEELINGLAESIARTDRHKECWNSLKSAMAQRGYVDFVNRIDEHIESN